MALRTKNEIWVAITNTFIAHQGTLTDISIRSELGKMFRAVSLEGEEAYSAIYDVYYDVFISKATGQGLDDRAADFGLARKTATFATVAGFLFYGEPGKTVRSGFLVQKNGTTLRYATSADVTIGTDGTGTVDLKATAAGAQYQAEANGIQEFAVSPPAGIDQGTNPARTTGGSDDEQDEELRSRIRQVLDYLAHGTPGAAVSAAQNVSGVRYAAYQEDYPQIGTDTVIAADNAGLLYAELKKEVLNALPTFRASGRQQVVSGATLANILIDSSVILFDTATPTSVKPDYESAVKQIFGSQLSFGSQIYPEVLKPQKVSGVKSTRKIELRIGIDSSRLSGVEIYDYSYRNAPIEKATLPIYYSPSSQTITLGNVAFSAEGGLVTVQIEKGDIASVTVYVDAALLPTVDIADQLAFVYTSSAGFQCPAYVLPVFRKLTLSQIAEAIINA